MKLKAFDFIAIIVSLIVFVSLFFAGSEEKDNQAMLIIKSENKQAVYPLSQDKTITVEGPVGKSVIIIQNGTAGFKSSDCKDKLCVLMGTINKSGEWAACLPNRVFISIEGAENAQKYDSLSY